MKCAYKLAIAKQSMNDFGMVFLQFCDGITAEYLYNMGWRKKRMHRFFNSHWDKLAKDLRFFRSDDDSDELLDSEKIVIVALKNRLKVVGMDADAIRSQFQTDAWKRRKGTEKKHQNRIDYLRNMETAVDGYFLTTCDFFRDNYGYGAIRLTRMYREFWQRYSEFCRWYTECDPYSDKRCVKESERIMRKLTEMGLELEDVGREAEVI